jgi:tetratricopeptide (TPR) repeat protein
LGSLNDLVWCLADMGEFAEGVTRAGEGAQIAEALGQQGLIFAYRRIGYLYLMQGELHKAVPVLERSLGSWQDFPGFFPWIATALGYAYALSERRGEAIPLLEQAVQRPASTGKVGHVVRVAYLSEAYLLAGRMGEAVEFALHALEFSRAHKERGNQAYALRLLGEIAARGDSPDVEQAETHHRQALTLAAELGMRPLMAHCHCGLGRLYARTGRPEHADTELSHAIKLFHTMEMMFWRTQAHTALAQGHGR